MVVKLRRKFFPVALPWLKNYHCAVHRFLIVLHLIVTGIEANEPALFIKGKSKQRMWLDVDFFPNYFFDLMTVHSHQWQGLRIFSLKAAEVALIILINVKSIIKLIDEINISGHQETEILFIYLLQEYHKNFTEN